MTTNLACAECELALLCASGYVPPGGGFLYVLWELGVEAPNGIPNGCPRIPYKCGYTGPWKTFACGRRTGRRKTRLGTPALIR